MNTKGFPYINLLSCKFLNASTGFVSGQSSILKTTNGGENWVNTLGVNNNVWNNLYMINDSLGYALSNYRQFYQTTNSGNNWNYITEVEPEFTINTMLFINSNTGFLIGKKSFGGPTYTTTGYVFKTTNSGLNWNGTLMGSENTCGISFVNDNTGYLSGARSMMYKTTNCGINWVYFRYNFNTNITFYSINFVNENTGWIIYNDDAFSSNGSGIYKTTNGGIDLEEQFHFPNERLGSLCVYDSNNIWITSQKARVYATSNGGVNWYYGMPSKKWTKN